MLPTAVPAKSQGQLEVARGCAVKFWRSTVYHLVANTAAIISALVWPQDITLIRPKCPEFAKAPIVCINFDPLSPECEKMSDRPAESGNLVCPTEFSLAVNLHCDPRGFQASVHLRLLYTHPLYCYIFVAPHATARHWNITTC